PHLRADAPCRHAAAAGPRATRAAAGYRRSWFAAWEPPAKRHGRRQRRSAGRDHAKEMTMPVTLPTPERLRTPGYRPGPDENRHTAWYYKPRVAGGGHGRSAAAPAASTARGLLRQHENSEAHEPRRGAGRLESRRPSEERSRPSGEHRTGPPASA